MDKVHKLAQDYFKIAMDEYETSRVEAKIVRAFNHNNHYTIEQLNVLRNRKQPEETFNIVKSYKRVLAGYLASTVNEVNVKASHPEYTTKATVANDIVKYVLKQNKFDMVRTDIQDELIISGLCGYELLPKLKGYDDLGIPDVDIGIRFISENELAIDPIYKNYDYSDARFIHSFKWVPNDTLAGILTPAKLEELDKQRNANQWVNTFNTDTTTFNGVYSSYHNSLLIKSQVKYKRKMYELIWCGNVLVSKRETKRFTIKPFTMERDIEETEYYGLFREVIESQKAINQALIQIQLMVNTNKVFVQTNALVQNDLEEFKRMYDRVNAIIPIKDLNGYKVENMSGDVVAQYNIISSALDRIKQVLNLNDSFLGMAGSSASGRQVKLQQDMSVSALSYLTNKINFIYESLALDILDMAKDYFKANKIMRVTDKLTGDRYVEMNKPVTINGQVQWKDIRESKDGITMIPWVYKDTTLDDLDYEVEVYTANYNSTDDLEKLQLDNIVQGPAGQMLMNTNPAAYARIISIQTKAMKTRNSEHIAEIFEDIASKLSGAEDRDPRDVGNSPQANEGTSAAGMMSAMGATNDAQPDGYNRPRG